jgi:hypothetical protein
MASVRPLVIALVLTGLGVGCTTIPAERGPGPAPDAIPAPFDHALLDAVLAAHVDDRGRVDYAGLARDRADLDAYYARLAAVSPDSHPALFPTEADRLAYWINAYNATVIVVVLHHYPIASVRDVGYPMFFFYPLAGFFYVQRVELGGERTNLYDLENRIIRGRFDDPRIHFALNCASISCPRLPARAFHPETLDAQLDAETRRFVSEARNVDVDPEAREVTLSAIFDWYEDDFTGWLSRHRPDHDPTLPGYVSLYLSPERARALAGCGDCETRFADYDWGLNDQRAPGPPSD